MSEEAKIPVDVVNEQVLIAGALVDMDVRRKLVSTLRPDNFITTEHVAAWAAIAEAEHRKLAPDPATLHQVGARIGVEVDVQYLLELLASRPHPPENLEFHVDALRWDKVRATAVMGPIAELIQELKDPGTARERIRALAKSVGNAFDEGVASTFLVGRDHLLQEQCSAIQKRREGAATWPFGVDGFDLKEDGTPRLVPGAAPGQITIVTGVSGSSKTPFVANLALGLARQRRPVLFGAWEVTAGMTLEWLAHISLASQGEWVGRAAFARGEFTDEELDKHAKQMKAILRWVTFMRNPFRRSIGHRETKRSLNDENLDVLQQHIADSGCQVFVGDLFERCFADDRPGPEKSALFRVQAMAEEQQVHMILTAQQRLKDIEQRPDKRPTREGIKGSSAWVEVADNLFGVHRSSLFAPVPDDTADVLIMKQRYEAWPARVQFEWDPLRYTYKNGRTMAYEHAQEQNESTLDVSINKDRPRQRFGGGKGKR